jgi:hypothetical protein
MPILPPMQTPEDPYSPPARAPAPPAREAYDVAPMLATGGLVTWVSGLVLMLSSFMGWYSGSGDGIVVSVIGWHTGPLGKLVFVIGLVVVAIAGLRELAGIELPPAIPEALVVIALGALATIFVLIRLISIPDEFLPASGRGIGIWISLVAAIAVIVAGLLRASEEL